MSPPSSPHGRHQLPRPAHIVIYSCIAIVLYYRAVFHAYLPYNDAQIEKDFSRLRTRRVEAMEGAAGKDGEVISQWNRMVEESSTTKVTENTEIQYDGDVEASSGEVTSQWSNNNYVTDAIATGFRKNQHKLMKPMTSYNDMSHCPSDLTEAQCKAMVPPHTGYKKVLVTGGAGFIGSHIAEFLLARGDDVVIVDEMNDYYNVKIKEMNLKLLRNKYPSEKRLSIYRGDICDAVFMSTIFETEKPKWVCHMAARAGVRPSIQDPYIYIESNIKGTTQLMELSHKHGVQNFVYASSSSVYGGSNSTFFSEHEVVDNPISPYAASKKATELFAHTFHHLYKLNMTGLRFFTVYGPRGRPDMAPFIFINRVSQGKPIKQFGDGSSSRDYTYISDIVDGIVRSIDRPHKYEVFNLGKGDGTSLKDFIHIVEKHTGKKANVQILPDQPGDVPYTCANVTKAHLLLGYQSKMPFEEGIRRTVEWYNATYVSTATS